MDALLDSFIFISVVKALVIFAVLMTTLAYLQWVERKVIAHIQVRPGPYRVGPHGLLQPLADVIKLITKEDLVPPYVNKVLYLAAPFLAITMALLSISVIPFGPAISIGPVRTWMQMTDLNIGCSSSWRCLPWACTASRWPGGPATTSTRCWADCAVRRR